MFNYDGGNQMYKNDNNDDDSKYIHEGKRYIDVDAVNYSTRQIDRRS